jgi:hypothetical protein
MQAKTNESPGIKSKMDDVAEAVAAVKRDLIEGLPKMRRAGRTDVSDLKVSLNALTPVSEPLYAVADRWWGAGVAGSPAAAVPRARQNSPKGVVLSSRTELRNSTQFDLESAIQC